MKYYIYIYVCVCVCVCECVCVCVCVCVYIYIYTHTAIAEFQVSTALSSRWLTALQTSNQLIRETSTKTSILTVDIVITVFNSYW
jgi:hypothetical protein